MIERYETEAMRRIWSEENKYRAWLRVELAVCRAWAEEGTIPMEVYDVISKKASFDIDRIREIESRVHHDVIAFVSCVAESVGEHGRFIHLGLTSSDVLDTASALLLKDSLDVITGELTSLKDKVLEKAFIYKHTPCVGRTHGVHAEPMSFGLKLLNWYSQLERSEERLKLAYKQINYGKISGAVGTYAHCPPSIEQRACSFLGLQPAQVSNQILQRDRHAFLLHVLALLGSSMENMALEIRHLQRTEVLEAMEPFSKGQKGSSAMPHKRNPILCERICGMARLLRGYSLSAMENVALWHERDISHSSVERVIWPDAFHIAHYMLSLLRRVVDGLEVNVDRMAKNINLTKGLVFSQRVLLALVDRGANRDEAYEVVQKYALKCWDGEEGFKEMLSRDPLVMSLLTKEELDGLFDVNYYLRFVDDIFDRFK
ncbi:MAG TPA: adenylosuccinate lyase [Acetomicrobium flavidum]|uniref:adenylosuccinate lyase n=1 Tax=Acetomicrobium flavidum TaxID=49896 RepID=UPI002B9702F0|nr:adenylosuccinate lyase [Acetomicrobium flavidum]